jgi:hypothetical protein
MFERGTSEFGRFSCSSANFSSEAGAVLNFFASFFGSSQKMKKHNKITKSRDKKELPRFETVLHCSYKKLISLCKHKSPINNLNKTLWKNLMRL